jgi:hypothetical protein
MSYCTRNESDVNGHGLADVENSLIWLDHVVSRRRRLDLVGQIVLLRHVGDVQGGLQLPCGVALDRLES